MRVLLLHLLVLGIIAGAPWIDRWSRYRYALSTRWAGRPRRAEVPRG